MVAYDYSNGRSLVNRTSCPVKKSALRSGEKLGGGSRPVRRVDSTVAPPSSSTCGPDRAERVRNGGGSAPAEDHRQYLARFVTPPALSASTINTVSADSARESFARRLDGVNKATTGQVSSRANVRETAVFRAGGGPATTTLAEEGATVRSAAYRGSELRRGSGCPSKCW